MIKNNWGEAKCFLRWTLGGSDPVIHPAWYHMQVTSNRAQFWRCLIITSSLITFRMHRWVSRLSSALCHLSLRGFCTVLPTAPKMVRILNVAEKNDAAKNIAEILSRGHLTRVSEPVALYFSLLALHLTYLLWILFLLYSYPYEHQTPLVTSHPRHTHTRTAAADTPKYWLEIRQIYLYCGSGPGHRIAPVSPKVKWTQRNWRIIADGSVTLPFGTRWARLGKVASDDNEVNTVYETDCGFDGFLPADCQPQQCRQPSDD